jgi:hypothetical protein
MRKIAKSEAQCRIKGCILHERPQALLLKVSTLKAQGPRIRCLSNSCAAAVAHRCPRRRAPLSRHWRLAICKGRPAILAIEIAVGFIDFAKAHPRALNANTNCYIAIAIALVATHIALVTLD